MRDLPRQLSVDELAKLFEGRTRLVERLAKTEDPLGRPELVIAGLTEAEKIEALAAHPAIGARRLSGQSAREQGEEAEPEVAVALGRLNDAYEEKFGFRFVVFVNRRPRADLVPILRERLVRTREEELETALEELVAIARDRWRQG
ncbi:MAG TPA: 2-oxo-4-hydroxy-4-carboxy-5-ureidoimidazoline decarboxylase [Gaiellaceae bacterium]|nr:2-oxo-4-hydroxy-4-carboxy-5-ureidoimidazoline decarboxylase [Gaiellaceae bacterium]